MNFGMNHFHPKPYYFGFTSKDYSPPHYEEKELLGDLSMLLHHKLTLLTTVIIKMVEIPFQRNAI